MDTWSDCACIMKPWACASSWATPFEEMPPHRRLWASRRQRPVSRPVSRPVRHRPCSLRLRHRLYLHLLRRRRPRRRLRPIWVGRAQSRAQRPCSLEARARPPRPPRPPASPAARPGGMPVAEGMRPAQASAPSRAPRSEGQADGREPQAARLMRVAISGTQWHSGALGAIERRSKGNQEAIKRPSRGHQEVIKRSSRGAACRCARDEARGRRDEARVPACSRSPIGRAARRAPCRAPPSRASCRGVGPEARGGRGVKGGEVERGRGGRAHCNQEQSMSINIPEGDQRQSRSINVHQGQSR